MGDGFDCDYIVVGSGAGGGTVAARLAEAGMDVILLEAGGDPLAEGAKRLPCDYDVPAFHPFASENRAMAWNYWVEHFPDAAQAKRDRKRRRRGVLYPRAGTLGGCTAHNAMIFMLPQASDWDGIAAMPGYAGWSSTAMTAYQHKVERCRHRPMWRWLSWLGLNPTGHGWNGWLSVEVALPLQAMADRRMRRMLEKAAAAAVRPLSRGVAALRRLAGAMDPNDRRMNGVEGLCFAPIATDKGCRVGTRERVYEAKKAGLRIFVDALATRLAFAADGGVCGVDYREGRRLYGASAPPSGAEGKPKRLRARREVILAAGAFNTPQLLMLSGIGPAAELRRHGIEVRTDLAGVGANLQDRYEVCVLSKLAQPWESMRGARFAPDDPLGTLWESKRAGMYVSNGAALALKRKSNEDLPDADLFMMALLGCFNGYYPGYSRGLRRNHDILSWAILKARTANRAGTVRLRSADPCDLPLVQFDYFNAAAGDDDLKAVAAAIGMVREIAAPLERDGLVVEELCPGRTVEGEALEAWIRDNAWGHHASCSCAMGPREQGGVLDSRLRVHGVKRLRVVDASIFPRIPGYFIVSAIYMAAEKAADMILEDAAASAAAPPQAMEEAA